MGRPTFTPKTAPFPSTISTACNTPFPRPTLLTTPNGIQIQSAVLTQYTFWTDAKTDGWSRRQVSKKSAYALLHLYIDSERHVLTSLPQSHLGRAHRSRTSYKKVLIGCNGTPQIHPKLPLPFDDHSPYLMHPSLDRPHLPSQMTSGSNQPFCHRTLSGHTHRQIDRQTDRWDRRRANNMQLALQ